MEGREGEGWGKSRYLWLHSEFASVYNHCLNLNRTLTFVSPQKIQKKNSISTFRGLQYCNMLDNHY